MAIVTSAEATQKSQESKTWGGGHGVFTHFVLEGMRGKADTDNDGIVTAGKLFEYVRENVMRATDNAQIPFIDANRFDRNLPMAITEIKKNEPVSSLKEKAIEPIESIDPHSSLVTENITERETIFRQAVTDAIDENHQINPIGDYKLTKLTANLGIPESTAITIKNDEIAKNIQLNQTVIEKATIAEQKKSAKLTQAKADYISVLNGFVEQGYYPFSKEIETELQEFGSELELSDSDIASIAQPILWQAKILQTKGSNNYSFEVITLDDRGQEKSRVDHEARFFLDDLGNGIALEMVAIPGGEFLMGTKESEISRLNTKFDKDYFSRESPQHLVNIKPFFMGKYPLTQAQWQAIMGNNPASFQDNPQHPVEQVSWDDAQEFCQKLSNNTGIEYRLPSEAEWEYAALAGTTTPFYFGETITTDVANYRGTDLEYKDIVYPGVYENESSGQYRAETTRVGSFPPNKFGLYDLHGNV